MLKSNGRYAPDDSGAGIWDIRLFLSISAASIASNIFSIIILFQSYLLTKRGWLILIGRDTDSSHDILPGILVESNMIFCFAFNIASRLAPENILPKPQLTRQVFQSKTGQRVNDTDFARFNALHVHCVTMLRLQRNAKHYPSSC